MEKIANFADRFNTALRGRNITAAELCRRTGISEAVMSQYKKGLYEPKYDRISQFASALNVSEAWLSGFDVEQEDLNTPYSLGKTLTNYRNKNKLSLRELAEQLEISHAYLRNIELGINPRSKKSLLPSYNICSNIASKLGISLNEVLIMAGYNLKENNYDKFSNPQSAGPAYPADNRSENDKLNHSPQLSSIKSYLIDRIKSLDDNYVIYILKMLDEAEKTKTH